MIDHDVHGIEVPGQFGPVLLGAEHSVDGGDALDLQCQAQRLIVGLPDLRGVVVLRAVVRHPHDGGVGFVELGREPLDPVGHRNVLEPVAQDDHSELFALGGGGTDQVAVPGVGRVELADDHALLVEAHAGTFPVPTAAGAPSARVRFQSVRP